ncbi:DNA/RNA-binding protein [Thermofilum pendens]|uniref:Nucleoid protein Alba n=1 Tax=Thermofilum pendens (strain DSM 2475 / Hrk 5) TaxID=368408 RepID=A1RZM9_THEPD|nr:DNA/RNA-binding protein [Thermofilum pendens]ABL78659.1 nucleoid protein Alba [Thermofilum pendens Hrk 5]
MGEEVLLVGEKPESAYTLELMTMLGKGAPRVVVRAVGRNISKAVYVTEGVRRLTGDKIAYGKIRIYSTEVGEVKEEKSVPVIEIEVVNLGVERRA